MYISVWVWILCTYLYVCFLFNRYTCVKGIPNSIVSRETVRVSRIPKTIIVDRWPVVWYNACTADARSSSVRVKYALCARVFESSTSPHIQPLQRGRGLQVNLTVVIIKQILSLQLLVLSVSNILIIYIHIRVIINYMI